MRISARVRKALLLALFVGMFLAPLPAHAVKHVWDLREKQTVGGYTVRIFDSRYEPASSVTLVKKKGKMNAQFDITINPSKKGAPTRTVIKKFTNQRTAGVVFSTCKQFVKVKVFASPAIQRVMRYIHTLSGGPLPQRKC